MRLQSIMFRLRIHRNKEFLVVLCPCQTIAEELHCLNRIHVRQMVAQNPHSAQSVFVDKQVVATSAAQIDVDSRIDAFVRELAVELQLHVAGAFELFKNNLVHLRAGFGQGCCQNGERASVLDVAGSSKEAFRLVKCVCIDTS